MSTSSTAWETLLTPKEIQAYGQLFNSVSTSTPGIITGQEAVRFFATSGVPNEILSEIWEAADKNNCGYLTPETFSLALKLIACAQHGREVSEPVFATVVPLPQFENTPLDTAASVVKSPPSAVDTITLEEREMYMSIFCAQDPKRTTMDAEIAKNILMKSKLPTDTLGQIWQLANGRQTGNLNTTEFVIAMHYVAKLMNGTLKALPAQLPPHIYAAASGTVPKEILPSLTSPHPMHSRVATPVHRNMTPPQRARTIDSLGSMAFASTATPAAHQWEITAQERAHSDGIFDQLDTHRVGILQGKEAVEFFKNSKLPDSELAAIWDMADTRRSGQLTREEFTIAMHLIQKRLTGDLLATDVPTGFATDMVNSPIVMPRFVSSVAPTSDPFMSAQDEDLLGEFGDEEQLTNDTNQVNQLQNQMAALQEASADVKARKEAKEKVLVQIMEQKQSVLEQTVQLQHSRDTELKTLKALEAVVEEEKPEWLQTQQEHDGAQQQLDVLQQEIDQLKQTFEEGQTENNRLRRQVATIQGEAAQCTRQLEKIRLKTLWTASGPGHTTTGVSSSESET
ncbi:hypothetical protein BDF14DRAFT_1188981 [Spinellus fusiger]|nr:hypothetical protein BDF14DRAFT_1188981 [Spinellus fusiger]